MADDDRWFVFAGAYSDMAMAEADFAAIKDVRSIGLIGKYQAALFTKDSDGKIEVLNTDSTTRALGTKWGMAAGAVAALIWPVGLLGGLVVGGGLGALTGNIVKGWSAGDVKELGAVLEDGESGILLVAEATPDVLAKNVLKQAKRDAKKQIDVEADDMEAAIDEVLS